MLSPAKTGRPTRSQEQFVKGRKDPLNPDKYGSIEQSLCLFMPGLHFSFFSFLFSFPFAQCSHFVQNSQHHFLILIRNIQKIIVNRKTITFWCEMPRLRRDFEPKHPFYLILPHMLRHDRRQVNSAYLFEYI